MDLIEIRRQVEEAVGASVLSPPIGNSRKGDGLGKEDVDIDFDRMVATCPGGVVTDTWTIWNRAGEQAPVFAWPAPPRRVIRISAQMYNSRWQYEALAKALQELLR